jgi:dihydroorotate dehydrogenase
MAKMLDRFDLVGLEINASCPNTKEDILTNTFKVVESCKAVRDVSRFPIILKLSVVHDVKTIVPQVEGIVEAISINSVPWSTAFPNKKSPLAHLGGGGVSGKIAQSSTWKLVNELAELTYLPIIGPGVWDYGDIETLRIIGVSAIGFGSIFLRYPWRPTVFVRRDMRR